MLDLADNKCRGKVGRGLGHNDCYCSLMLSIGDKEGNLPAGLSMFATKSRE
jgi:hypothetical protein